MQICVPIEQDELRREYRRNRIELLDHPRAESPLGHMYLVRGTDVEYWDFNQAVDGPPPSLRRVPDITTSADEQVKRARSAKMGAAVVAGIVDRLGAALGTPGLELAARFGFTKSRGVQVRVVGGSVERLNLETLRQDLALARFRKGVEDLGRFLVVTGAWSAVALSAAVTDDTGANVSGDGKAAGVLGGELKLEADWDAEGQLVLSSPDRRLYYAVELRRIVRAENNALSLGQAGLGSARLSGDQVADRELITDENAYPFLEVKLAVS